MESSKIGEIISNFPESFIEDLIASLKPVSPTKIMIFGSAVYQGLEARDLDIVVISEKFKGVLWHRRKDILHLPKGPKYDLNLLTELEFQLIPSSHPLKKGLEDCCLYLEGI